MTSAPPQPKENLRLNTKTLRVMRKRREWRRRALDACVAFATWPAGKPGREKIGVEATKSLNKIHQWFRATKAQVVVRTIQSRAVSAFRNQFTKTP